MTSKTILWIVVVVIGIAAAALLLSGNDSSLPSSENVTMVDGKQVIAINVKAGYSPRVTTAKAGVPTVIKLTTQGTFDCSSAITIPLVGYRNNLPASGETLVDIPAQRTGDSLRGVCTMGMYSFLVNFR